MRIEDLLRKNARTRPDAMAVACEHAQLTWSELDAWSNRLANSLLARGYQEQDRVAVVLPNCHHIPVTYFALWKCNLVSVAINPKLTSTEITAILRHAGAVAVIHDAPAAAQAAAAAPTVRDLISVDGSLTGSTSLSRLLADSTDKAPPRLGEADDLRSIRFTSGTTGQPKGCMATHAQQLASVSNFLIEVEVPRTGPTYLSVPMTLGVGAFYLTAAAYLGTPLLVRSRFRAEQFLADVADRGVSHAFLVPTMLTDLAALVAGRQVRIPESLRLLGYGGAPIAWDTLRTVAGATPADFYQGLGATEAGGYVTLLTPAEHRELIARAGVTGPVTIGRPAAYARAQVVDGHGRPAAPGEVGELRIRSASTFSGYWQQPEQTAAVLVDGWLALGDMVWEDPEGYLHLVDRKQGVIRSGSQNVYAGEVEAVLQTCPGVARAAVIGVRNERFGESVKALVVRVPGASLSEEDVIAHCTTALAGYKRPRAVEFVSEIPVDDGGKIRRAELRRRYAGSSNQ